MAMLLYKTLHSLRDGADRACPECTPAMGGPPVFMSPVFTSPVFAAMGLAPAMRLRAAWLLAVWLLCGPAILAIMVVSAFPALPAAHAAGNTLGQDATAVQQFIRTGAELADAYGVGPICGRIGGDMDKVRSARTGSEAAMKRLLLVENDPRQEMLRAAFRRANESASRLERTLDGTEAVCRQGGDARIDSTGFRLRLENEALFLAENGRTLCRTLRTEVPGMAWPDCDRP